MTNEELKQQRLVRRYHDAMDYPDRFEPSERNEIIREYEHQTANLILSAL
jgi:hypothetical protein